ncbi:PadR family transcriptional regulator [Deinococcus marmoris]|uniref:Transcription regulator PadR N-terminal domain-containing protein n=1 Tax=Deinococcus marmoris TaxID=249408 RepID=A0A1U7P4U0_9DEIO|nr:helix-turn-helix transcriptional regulator [Deinococcus marmoris]OLV20195.1 hypothetical protein BOO71_0000613 [Deinococcus marmoris]
MFTRIINRFRLRRIPAETRVLHALLTGHQYALPLSQEYAVNIGSLYAHLIRLERAGLIWSEFETGPAPRRRRYVLTAEGRAWVEQDENRPRLNDLLVSVQISTEPRGT